MPHVNELHEQHDPILIVSLAGGDLAAADRDYATAQSLVAGCADCARLHDEVIALATATKALPPAVRTRDFQISPEQAAKLRPAGLRGVLARLTAPGAVFSRQLGVGMATLGVAGLLIGSLGTINLGMSGSAAAPSMPASAPEQVGQAPAAASPAASAAAELDPNQAFSGPRDGATPETNVDTSAGGPQASGDQTVRSVAGGAAAGATPVPSQNRDADAPLAATGELESASSDGPSPLIIASMALLVAGVLVLIVRRVGRSGLSR